MQGPRFTRPLNGVLEGSAKNNSLREFSHSVAENEICMAMVVAALEHYQHVVRCCSRGIELSHHSMWQSGTDAKMWFTCKVKVGGKEQRVIYEL